MIPQADQFITRLRASLQDGMRRAATRTIAKDAHVYICGDYDATVYAIVRGHMKLLALSPAGKQCLLAIYTAGDIFGELGLAERGGGITGVTRRWQGSIPMNSLQRPKRFA
jgi:CRP/FNR family transcriptional regulator, cyclic AMP receptor protein